jgi:hypothetical protein
VCTAADASSVITTAYVCAGTVQEVLAQSRRQDAAVGTGQDVRSVFTRRDIHQVRTQTLHSLADYAFVYSIYPTIAISCASTLDMSAYHSITLMSSTNCHHYCCHN